MPVNYLQIQRQINEKCSSAGERQLILDDRLARARALLAQHAASLDELRERVEQAASREASLRCAAPLLENLTAAIAVPESTALPLLLAADGSQVNPSRHDPIEFAVINIGIFRIQPSGGVIPAEETASELYLFEDLDNPLTPLTEEVVALKRDLSERRMLARRAEAESGSFAILTLTDGPLELYREPRENRQFDQLFREYLQVLERMAQMNVITAGYVDKPASDLVVRLLELTLYPIEQARDAQRDRPLAGVRDHHLYAGLLQPGQRSAVFAIQSPGSSRFGNYNLNLMPCFFYLNTAQGKDSMLARVEIPRWVALRPALVDMLHAALLQQCRQTGSQPYPYALHRAHEIALVSREEKEQIQAMITRAMRGAGLEVGEKSAKQALKDLPAKGRHTP